MNAVEPLDTDLRRLALQEGHNLAAFFIREDGEMLAYVNNQGHLIMPLFDRCQMLDQSACDMSVGANGEVAIVTNPSFCCYKVVVKY